MLIDSGGFEHVRKKEKQSKRVLNKALDTLPSWRNNKKNDTRSNTTSKTHTEHQEPTLEQNITHVHAFCRTSTHPRSTILEPHTPSFAALLIEQEMEARRR